jgi:hypothetical protein
MGGYRSRVIRGKCVWEYAPIAEQALDRVLNTDPFAHGALIGLIEESQEPGGLGAAIGRDDGYDYRAPLPRLPPRLKDPPWLGELKVKGKRGTEHRLYFSEPDDLSHTVVAVGYGYKDPRDVRGPLKQSDQIRKAMAYTRYWFRVRGYAVRPFDAAGPN